MPNNYYNGYFDYGDPVTSCWICGNTGLRQHLAIIGPELCRTLCGYDLRNDTAISLCFTCLDNARLCPECGEYHVVPLRRIHPAAFYSCVGCHTDHRIQETPTRLSNSVWLCPTCAVGLRQRCDICDTEWYRGWTQCPCDTVLNHGAKPMLRFYDKSLTPRTKALPRILYMGMELEVETGGRETETQKLVKAAKLPLFCKYDGSLRQGVEIVSMPLTYEAWMALWERLTTLYGELRALGCRSFATTTCGLHIHASKAGFRSLGHLYRLARFMYNNKSKLTALSQRSPSLLRRWATFDDIAPVSDGKTNTTLVRKVRRPETTSTRYAALNLLPLETAEFRLFKGTLYPNAIQRALETVQALRDYTLATSMTDADKWSQFQGYVTSEKKTFPQLYAWAVENKHDHDKQAVNY